MVITGLRRVGVVLVCLLGVLMFAVLVLPRILGWQAYVVTSGSMAPTFDAGAVVLTSPVRPDELMTGDIVTFQEPSGLTTHRIVGMSSTSSAGVTTNSFTTQGDANEEADPAPLDPRNVVGKAEYIVPRLGHVVGLMRSPWGAGLLAALILFVLMSQSKKPEIPRNSVTAPEAVPAP